MKQILFICTGNYYRSRIAEILFNHLAEHHALSMKAFSRGLRLNPEKNKGVISPHAPAFLAEMNIVTKSIGLPVKLKTADLEAASEIFVLDETEHRPMVRDNFPEWEDKMTFWNFEDDYVVSPEHVLPRLRRKIEALVHERLSQ